MDNRKYQALWLNPVTYAIGSSVALFLYYYIYYIKHIVTIAKTRKKKVFVVNLLRFVFALLLLYITLCTIWRLC